MIASQLFNIYNGWVSFLYQKEKNGIVTYYYYQNLDNIKLSEQDYLKFTQDISKSLVHPNEVRIYEKDVPYYVEHPTQEEIFFNNYIASLDAYRSPVEINIDNQSYDYISDYIFKVQDIQEFYESAMLYFKYNKILIDTNLTQDEIIFKYINYFDDETFQNEEIKRFESNKATIKLISKHLIDTYKHIKNIDKIVPLLPIYFEALNKYQSHILSDETMILGCDCGCGGDSISDRDYDTYQTLAQKVQKIEDKLKYYLNLSI